MERQSGRSRGAGTERGAGVTEIGCSQVLANFKRQTYADFYLSLNFLFQE